MRMIFCPYTNLVSHNIGLPPQTSEHTISCDLFESFVAPAAYSPILIYRDGVVCYRMHDNYLHILKGIRSAILPKFKLHEVRNTLSRRKPNQLSFASYLFEKGII
jgi:hypothetical protein